MTYWIPSRDINWQVLDCKNFDNFFSAKQRHLVNMIDTTDVFDLLLTWKFLYKNSQEQMTVSYSYAQKESRYHLFWPTV